MSLDITLSVFLIIEPFTMNFSIIISVMAVYGAATMGCADDLSGRPPKQPSVPSLPNDLNR
jgi:hypothetical protein